MKILLYAGLTLMIMLGIVSNRSDRFLADNQLPEENTEATELSDFEKAVEIIKKYEGLHQPKHWPLVGYGHKVLPGEKYSRTKAMNQVQAEELLRKDLLKNCAVFRSFGADSLILGVLAYNIGSGAAMRSTVAKKLKAGDRDIYDNYIAHSKYKGKTMNQIKRRRIEEFETLFIKEPDTETENTQTVSEVEHMVKIEEIKEI